MYQSISILNFNQISLVVMAYMTSYIGTYVLINIK